MSQSLRCECHGIHGWAFPANRFLGGARGFPDGFLPGAGLRFRSRLFRGGLFRQFCLERLLDRLQLLARSSLGVLLFGFLLGSHRRSVPPLGHSRALAPGCPDRVGVPRWKEERRDPSTTVGMTSGYV